MSQYAFRPASAPLQEPWRQSPVTCRCGTALALRAMTRGVRHGAGPDRRQTTWRASDGSGRGENDDRNAARAGAFGRRSFLKGAAAGRGRRRLAPRRPGDRGRARRPNAVSTENALPGSPPSEWDSYEDTSIEGFATDISVNAGETVSFKVATDATAYRIRIYRMGWYQGLGARRVAELMPSVAAAAGPAAAADRRRLPGPARDRPRRLRQLGRVRHAGRSRPTPCPASTSPTSSASTTPA